MDDYGDFTSFGQFTSAQGNSITAVDTSKEAPATMMTGINMDAFSFDSLQGAGGVPEFQNFPDFSQFGVDGDAVHVAGGVQFEIPPLPLSPDPENFHVVGGVPFEMPPLPDFPPDEMETVTKVSDSDQTWSANFEPNHIVRRRDQSDAAQANVTNDSTDDFGEFASSSKLQVNDESSGFGDFSGFQAVTGTSSGGVAFGTFSNSGVMSAPQDEGAGLFPPPPLLAGDSSLTTTSAENVTKAFGATSSSGLPSNSATMTTGGNGFGGFSGNARTAATGSNSFGDFSVNSGAGALTIGESSASVGGSATADFGAFASNSVTTGESEEFGDFSSSFVSTTAAGRGNDLGKFSARTEEADEFGGFSSGPVTTTVAGNEKYSAKTGADDDFRGYTSMASGDDFGQFSGASGSAVTSSEQNFAAFSSAPPDSGGVTSKARNTAAPLLRSTNKSAAETLGLCFAGQTKATSPSPTPLLESVGGSGETAAVDQDTRNNQRLWCVLQNCLDLTVPLHKFDKSFVENCYYYLALSVDPMLVSRPSTLSLLTGMARFEAPLGGATAVEDLRESFGFEGDLAQTGSPTEQITSPFRRQSEAALLDLSFPLSPSSPTRDSFTLTADLAGLDLNPEPKQEKKLTSIQELLLNERLVVNRSTWMDSQLAELGGGAEGRAINESTSQPNTPSSAKRLLQNNMESQLELLGLDASKTTSIKTSKRELSLSARSVLGRLPDLSFMTLRNKMEKRTLYFRGSS